MKRIARLLRLASALLLAGCVPNSLEEFVGWRDKFFLQLTPTQIQHYLGPILAVVIAVTVLKTLSGIASHRSLLLKFQWFAWFVGQVLAIVLIYYLPSFANTITVRALPPELTLDAAVASLHLGISLDPTKALTSVWALGTLSVLPVIIMVALLVGLLISIIVLLQSTLWTKNKALWTAVAVLLGHWLFLIILVTSLGILKDNYPNWDFVGVAATINSGFLFIIILAGLACYVALPILGIIYGPNFGPSRESTEEADKEKGKKKRDLDIEGLVPIFFPPSPQTRPNEDSVSSTPAGSQPQADDAILEGVEVVYPDEPYGPVIYGQAHNTWGLPRLNAPDTPDIIIDVGNQGNGDGPDDLDDDPVSPSSNPPSGGPLSPSSTGGNHSTHPDWVPPIREVINIKITNPAANPPPETTPAAQQPVPTSAKIHKAKDVGNKATAVVEIGATLLGHPEVAMGAQKVRTVSNATLTAAEKAAKKKESNLNWVP